jgi:ubiquinone/menaquinone biosynthesis C-methylase UbiE
VSGIPVFLLAEKDQTIGIAKESLAAAESAAGAPLYVDTLGLSEQEKRGIERNWSQTGKVDAAISHLIGATNGRGYAAAIGRLENYPIPDIPVGVGSGEFLLDVGSNWGRWSVSAARKGWRVVGIDPSLGALLAAQRAFSAMGLKIAFVCGDARYLPFKADAFRCVFSFSVIQHLSETDAELCIAEIGRVLHRGGSSKIQMAHRGGLRSTYTRLKSDYLDSGIFRVRYWSLAQLSDTFTKHIGPSTLSAEAFGGLGLLAEDREYVSTKARVMIAISTSLKKAASFVRPLIRLADSVYVVSVKH